jgi:hypothetical protein
MVWKANSQIGSVALEAIEMLIDYGIEPGLLVDWYREWVEQLINRQTRYQLTYLEGWLELGRVIQPGAICLMRYNKRLLQLLWSRLP